MYISSDEFGWLPARVVGPSVGKSVVVAVVDYDNDEAIPVCEVGAPANRRKAAAVRQVECNLDALPLQNVDSSGRLNVVNDMVDLPFLHEAAILYNLKARHVQGVPYTRTGDIVIAVNPYQWLHSLYSAQTRNLYAEKLVWNHGMYCFDIDIDIDIDSDIYTRIHSAVRHSL